MTQTAPQRGWRKYWPSLPAGDLLRDAIYRRLWLSILISSFGGQITMLALPLTAAVLLNASASQMGILTAMEVMPFALLSLPSGVWLDRVRKLPVYIAGEAGVALALASVPLAWTLGWLSMYFMYGIGFFIGCIWVTAGTAAQIVLTQVVPRERLVEAHAKNALASSGAEVAGPGAAGALIKLAGAPLALLVDAVLLAFSVIILRGLRVAETRVSNEQRKFWDELKEGVRFVLGHRLLVALAVSIGCWHFAYHSALVVQILYATRELGLSEHEVGLCYTVMGVGTILASTQGNRVSQRIGPGPSLILGFVICGLGWLQLALAPTQQWGVLSFVLMLLCFGCGAVLLFINFLALRQAVTPEPLLGRMTSTMRWLALLPAGPGALFGGYVGEHFGMRHALAFAGGASLLLAAWAWRHPLLPKVRILPTPDSDLAVRRSSASR
jgi:MFS family permease